MEKENNPIFNPEEIIKREARGINDAFLGQVQEIHLIISLQRKGQ